MRVRLYAPGEPLLTAAERALMRAGCGVRAEWERELMDPEPGEIGLMLDETGEGVLVYGDRGILSEAENQQLALLDGALDGSSSAAAAAGHDPQHPGLRPQPRRGGGAGAQRPGQVDARAASGGRAAPAAAL
jgi:hypothetical protein